LVIEDEGANFFRNIGSHSANDTVSHPKDLCSQLHHRDKLISREQKKSISHLRVHAVAAQLKQRECGEKCWS